MLPLVIRFPMNKSLRQIRQPGRWLSFHFLLVVALCATEFVALGGSLGARDLRCEFLKNPLGIDTPQPRLSWILDPGKASLRNQAQSAYQILVASRREMLDEDRGDIWDSRKVESDQSIHVPYAGRPLLSSQECFWKVRIWNLDGKESDWSEPAYWSMGLLRASDWHGKWIGLDEAAGKGAEGNVLGGAQWIWFPGGEPEKAASPGKCYFQRVITLPAGAIIKRATVDFTADDSGEFFVNGQKAGSTGNFHAATTSDISQFLRPGENVLAGVVQNGGATPNPAGFIASVHIDLGAGEPVAMVTDSSWLAATNEFSGWQSAPANGDGWQPAKKLGAPGMAPWGKIAAPEIRDLPARMLRQEFAVGKKIQRATVYVSGLGLSELYLNGEKVSLDVLSPGLTDYSKRVLYVTYDVTKQLRRGRNALGVILGNGRFYAPRADIPTGTASYGFPKLRLQMSLQYEDGTEEEVTSDTSWKLTTEGPIRSNNEYDGEDYDARREMPRWSEAGFNDLDWQAAKEVSAPGGGMSSQMIEPIRVVEILKPIALTQPRPGVWIFDLGQNMVGWCRLKVSGPAGTVVAMRHAETLTAEGTLYLDNIRSAKVTDTYTLKGKGTEVYAPRFTYHGFRFVEVTGYPGKPRLDSIEGEVVRDNVETAGTFVCSNPLLNRIYHNILWGVAGNYRSITTDCPQRDERQGWLGDRAAECKGETYLFDIAALYAKWVQDIADAQKTNGSVSDVCPAFWPIYSDNVTWPSATVIIPGILRDQYADDAVVKNHYDSAKRWLDYMSGFVTNGLIKRDSYGDWCVPPEDPKLIHSKDPARQTDKTLLASAYLYHDARLMAGFAFLLHKDLDARHFEALADKLKTAFNKKFFNSEKGQYDNGSQTSCVLPLAFGLVPEGERQRVFDCLVDNITTKTHNHIGTGLIGGQWLMRVLTENGRPDLAYTIATQETYPSWGYMVAKGATTIWELWNGDTADPAMNSGNHVMLVGDLGIWLNENVAGIKSDLYDTGFKQIVMRPEPVGDLKSAKAEHQSPYGLISSEWVRDGEAFRWNITVPPNTTAIVHVPAKSAAGVLEDGKPVSQAPGVLFLRMENGRAVFKVGSGIYKFES